LGLCKQADLDAALKRASRRVAREQKAAAKSGIVPEAQPDIEMETPAMEPSTNDFVDPAAQEQPDITDDDVSRGMGLLLKKRKDRSPVGLRSQTADKVSKSLAKSWAF